MSTVLRMISGGYAGKCPTWFVHCDRCKREFQTTQPRWKIAVNAGCNQCRNGTWRGGSRSKPKPMQATQRVGYT